MSYKIGLLLPRSTDYPAMGFDILHGLRSFLDSNNIDNTIVSENIGFGEDNALNYAKAEKLLLQDNADVLVTYCNSSNAEALYQLAEASGKKFIFLDAGMQLPHAEASTSCYHISLQGIHACRLSGYMAGSGNRKVLMATSFYEGGYRGPWCYDRGLSEAGGSVCGNYVSAYKTADFTLEPYIGMMHQSGASSVAACFSSYLAELFFKELREKNHEHSLPVYCSPFMAEEQLLEKCDFPGGEFFAVVPWGKNLNTEAQKTFVETLPKNKPANLFHLLGWEAGIILASLNKNNTSLEGFSYESPRGQVTIHPQTHYTFSSLYKGEIKANEKGKCDLIITGEIPVTAEDHLRVMQDRPMSVVSGWRNNYLCI